jgi:GMP synthase-like glutamine amidotransferase
MRIIILEADKPMDVVAKDFGSYEVQFKKLLQVGGVKSTDSIESYDVVEGQYPTGDIDAVLITGSKYSAYQDDEWIVKLVDFTKRCIERSIKIVGICFGHQILARALGTPVIVNPKGWEISATAIESTELGKKVFPELQNGISIMQMHRDIVSSLPKGTQLLAQNSVCEIQGFYAQGQFLALQGHPEYVGEVVKRMVQTRHSQGIFNDELAQSALSRVDSQNDGPILAKAIVRFIYGEI